MEREGVEPVVRVLLPFQPCHDPIVEGRVAIGIGGRGDLRHYWRQVGDRLVEVEWGEATARRCRSHQEDVMPMAGAIVVQGPLDAKPWLGLFRAIDVTHVLEQAMRTVAEKGAVDGIGPE